MLLTFSEQPEGIPDGGAIYVRWNRVKSSGEGPIVSAISRVRFSPMANLQEWMSMGLLINSLRG